MAPAAIHIAQRQVPGSFWIPIGQRWFTGTYALHTGTDTKMVNYAVKHPNDAGHRHMAARVEADLQA